MDTFKFDSVADLLSHLESATAIIPSEGRLAREHSAYHGFMCADRPGLVDYAGCKAELGKARFDAGVTRVTKLGANIQAPTPISVRRVARRDDHGDELDMQRVWSGELNTAWRRMHRASRVGPMRVLVVVDVSGNSNVSAESLAWRGVAALTLADKLSEAGHTVSVVAAAKMRFDGKDRQQIEVTAQDFGSVLDVHVCASLMASGMFLRGVLLPFYWLHTKVALGPGCGQSSPLAQADFEGRPGVDYTAVATADTGSKAGAEAWVAKHIAALDARVSGEAAA